jgi:hypothetical protein
MSFRKATMASALRDDGDGVLLSAAWRMLPSRNAGK